jgi:hypothetical protein
MLWVRFPSELLTHVLAEQPGVLATLSRWRSSVQIRPGTLKEGARGQESGASPEQHHLLATGSWLPAPVLRTCVGWALASLSGCNPPALGALQVQLLPGALTRPVRLEAGFQPLNLERRVRFPHGSLIDATKWWNPPDTLAPERRALVAWEFKSPLGY